MRHSEAKGKQRITDSARVDVSPTMKSLEKLTMTREPGTNLNSQAIEDGISSWTPSASYR